MELDRLTLSSTGSTGVQPPVRSIMLVGCFMLFKVLIKEILLKVGILIPTASPETKLYPVFNK